MQIFDQSVVKILEYLKNENVVKLNESVPELKFSDKNIFLMERDTAIELGGYPKESINIYVPSSNLQNLLSQFSGEFEALSSGVYCIGNPDLLSGKEKQISFGKIVLLQTEEIPEDKWYEFTQKELITDSKIRVEDVMLRQSSVHYNVNLKIGKKAVKNGFNLETLGKTIRNSFMKIEGVKDAAVILIAGESSLYKNLLPVAEKIKEITLALNHIFDGIEMDCGHCNLVEICNEVEGMRKLHKSRNSKV